MEIFLDAAVILIISAAAIAGYYRGFVKYVVLLLVTVFSVIAAFVAANSLTDKIFDKYLKERIENSVEDLAMQVNITDMVKKGLESAGLSNISEKVTEEDIRKSFEKGELSDNIEKIVIKKGGTKAEALKAKEKFFIKMNEGFSEKLEKAAGRENYLKIAKRINITNDQISNAVRLFAENEPKQAAEYLNKEIIFPVIKSVLKMIVFIAAFLASSVIFRLLLLIFGVFKRLPAVSMANRFGGLLLGFVKGGLYASLLSFLLCILVNSTSDSLTGFNTDMVEKTRLFKYFFNFFYK